MKPSQSIETATTQAKVNAITEISKVSVAFITITAGAIGCWATVSLFAGTISSGGPLGLIQNFITTITG